MISNLLDLGNNIIDKLWPDKAEAEAAKLRLIELQQKGELAELEHDLKQQQELTKRHSADMTSDSWLSKNIRPLALVVLMGGYFVFATGSAFGIQVTEAYVELLGQWGMLAFSFYFGSRGMEKIAQVLRDRKRG